MQANVTSADSDREVLAGLVERVTYHNPENGFCVLRIKARGHRDLAGFRTFDINTGQATIHGRVGGDGPPLLLLHGYPQTHAMWHRVAPILASTFTVVVADLRGYGRSSKPATSPDHAPIPSVRCRQT